MQSTISTFRRIRQGLKFRPKESSPGTTLTNDADFTKFLNKFFKTILGELVDLTTVTKGNVIGDEKCNASTTLKLKN